MIDKLALSVPVTPTRDIPRGKSSRDRSPAGNVPKDGLCDGAEAEFRSQLDRLDPTHLSHLLVRSGKGDQQAFAEFYRLTSPVLAVLAARRLPFAAADTLLVDTYVAIWRQAGTFHTSRSSVWQWTLTILTEARGRHPRGRATAVGGQHRRDQVNGPL